MIPRIADRRCVITWQYRLLASCIASILFIASNVGVIGAAPSQAIPGLDNPSAKTTRTDLERLMDLAVGKKISFAQGMAFYNLLSQDQKIVLTDIVNVRLEQAKVLPKQTPPPSPQVPPRPKTSASAGASAEIGGGLRLRPLTANMYGGCIEGGGTQCWNEPVEYHDAGGVRPSYWWWSQYDCDNDPDADYAFNISLDLHRDPDGARWFTDDFALWLTTGRGGSLNGFGYNYYEMRLCVAEKSLAAAGFWGENAAAEAHWHIFGRYY